MPTGPARRQTVAHSCASPREKEVTLMSDLLTIPGLGPATKSALEARGIHTKSHLAQMRVEDLLTIRGVSTSRAEAMIRAAQDLPVDPAEPAAQTEPAAQNEPTPAPPTAAEERGAPGTQPKQNAPEPAFEPATQREDEPESDAEPDPADNVVRLNPKAFKGQAKSRLKALKQDKKTAKAKLETAKAKLKAAVKALAKAKKEKKAASKPRSANKKAKSRRKA